MSRLALTLRRYPLWAAFAVVAVPLLALLCFQFVWLSRLAHVTAIAHEFALQNYVRAVGTEIQYFYRSAAARALNVPASAFTEGKLDEAAAMWAAKPVEGARRLFLVDYTREQYGRFLFYDPLEKRLLPMPASDEALAIIIASSPWQMSRTFRRRTSALSGPIVDERNADYRLVLNPVTDEWMGVVGIAGMVLDEDYFARTLLPKIVRNAVPSYFPGSTGDLGVVVRDAKGRTLYESGGARPRKSRGEPIASAFPFVFTDWTFSLQRPSYSPEEWARTSFVFNIGISLLLAVVLLAGVVLALRAADKAVRLSTMKADFVSNVSHELRTPVASIRVFAELLRLGRVRDADKVQAYGAHIEAESRRLTGLIDNILDFSRIESGQKRYTFAAVEIGPIVEQVVDTFNARLERDGVSIVLDAPSAPVGLVEADAAAIGQAVHNLVDNAVKYSGPEPRVRVRLAREDHSIVIAVSDEGIGIPREEQVKIFDRFHRVGTGLVHDVKGCGLGLAIVRHVVESHGGSVSVRSAPGTGSTFTITLPLGAQPAERSVRTEESHA